MANRKECLNCGSEIKRKRYASGRLEDLSDFNARKFCKHMCYTAHNVGTNHANFKRGYRMRPDGYLRNSNDKYIHRLTVEKYLGRPLGKNEHVHHIDGNPANNNINNLELHTNSSHRKLEVLTQERGLNGRFKKSTN